MASWVRSATRREDRGQTSIDFLIGAAVFMLAVAFVFGVIPGMIDPFSDAQEETLVTDRVASHIADGLIGEPGRPGVANETCSFAFFNATGANGEDCPIAFNKSDDLSVRVGIDDAYRLNVTLERDVSGDGVRTILCTDGSRVGACSDLPMGDRLAAGPSAPRSTDAVHTARRTVFLDGKDATLVVRLW